MQTNKKILIVEDDLTSQNILTRLLKTRGYNVCTAGTSREAMAMTAQEEPKLALVDIVLPEVSGVDFLRWIRKNHPEIPVIMLSVLDDMDSVIKCLQLGAEDYLSKPIDPVLLRARINACLERWRPDLAHRQQLQEQFQQAQEMESAGRHPGGVTHAFNNMLSVLLQAAQRSVTLVRQLMVFSRRR